MQKVYQTIMEISLYTYFLLVQWKSSLLPRGWPEFDSRPSPFFRFNFLFFFLSLLTFPLLVRKRTTGMFDGLFPSCFSSFLLFFLFSLMNWNHRNLYLCWCVVSLVAVACVQDCSQSGSVSLLMEMNFMLFAVLFSSSFLHLEFLFEIFFERHCRRNFFLSWISAFLFFLAKIDDTFKRFLSFSFGTHFIHHKRSLFVSLLSFEVFSHCGFH